MGIRMPGSSEPAGVVDERTVFEKDLMQRIELEKAATAASRGWVGRYLCCSFWCWQGPKRRFATVVCILAVLAGLSVATNFFSPRTPSLTVVGTRISVFRGVWL